METADTTLHRGDIIRSPRGYLAQVNWSKLNKTGDGKLEEWIGCTFIDKGFKGVEHMTYRADEVFVVRRGTQEFWKEMFKHISDEALRDEIKAERALRVQVPEQKQRSQSVIRISSMLKELTGSDQEALVKMLRERRENR